MKTLQITEQNAQKFYEIGSLEFKQVLEDTFGKAYFQKSIMDRVKSYEDACVERGKTPIDKRALRAAGASEKSIAFMELETITEALNEGMVMDWENPNQKKWIPWFLTSSGFVFGATNYDCSAACAGDASRLCFKSEKLARYAGQQFIDLYRRFIL